MANGSTTGDIWNQWFWSPDTSITTTAVSDVIWGNWTGNTTTSITTMMASNHVIWQRWISASGTTAALYAPRVVAPQLTPEQIAAAEERARVERAASEERNHVWAQERARTLAVQTAANRRAMELLHSMLSKAQSDSLKANNYFVVDAPSGRRYRIDQGSHGNVRVIDKITGALVERLCVQPQGVPEGDAMLMQKLLIETAEDVFRKTANISGPRGESIGRSAGLLTGDKLIELAERPVGLLGRAVGILAELGA